MWVFISASSIFSIRESNSEKRCTSFWLPSPPRDSSMALSCFANSAPVYSFFHLPKFLKYRFLLYLPLLIFVGSFLLILFSSFGEGAEINKCSQSAMFNFQLPLVLSNGPLSFAYHILNHIFTISFTLFTLFFPLHVPVSRHKHPLILHLGNQDLQKAIWSLLLFAYGLSHTVKLFNNLLRLSSFFFFAIPWQHF